jgi:hypothetical protein
MDGSICLALIALIALITGVSGNVAPRTAKISNVIPRRDNTGTIINAHAGGIYNFSNRFYLIGEHYHSCPHAGSNKTKDPLAVGDCEICGHTGTTFALYTSDDLETWTLNTTNIIPDKPGGANAALYTPVLAYNAKYSYYVLMFQCSGGCSDGQLQVATAASPAGPFKPRGTVLPSSDPRHGSSQGGIWVDDITGTAYFIFNSIGDASNRGQWIVELDDTYLRMTNHSTQIIKGAAGSEGGWLEGGGVFKQNKLYYYMAGSGCCYCAGGGGAMVFVAPHPLGPWTFQTNVNDALYLPFSPTGPPPTPPTLPPTPVPSPADACSDLSGEWASSVLTPNYQPLRAGLIFTKILAPPTPLPPPNTVGLIVANSDIGGGQRCIADSSPVFVARGSFPRDAYATLEPCSGSSKAQVWLKQRDGDGVRLVNQATGRCVDAAHGEVGRLVYVHECVGGVGQVWTAPSPSGVTNATGDIVNVAAKTCVSAQTNGSLVMEVCTSASTSALQAIRWTIRWTFVATSIVALAPPTKKDYYNITSTTKTHWPAVPRKGWLLEVDPSSKAVVLSTGNHGVHASKLQPWLNPWSNGQMLPPAADCTMIAGATSQVPTVCKLPYCGESLRPVAAQQFNVLSLGGKHLYYGERWQSTPTGFKADDFSYMEPLRFDANGVAQRMEFTDNFELLLHAAAP